MKILVVEDDELIKMILRKHLGVLGHEVEEANNGIGGLEKIKNGNFDLVITDIMMPIKSGIEMALDLKKLGLPIPVFALTASSPKIIENEFPGLFIKVFPKSSFMKDILNEIFDIIS